MQNHFIQHLDTPVGFLTVVADDQTIVRLHFGRFGKHNENDITRWAADELADYFSGRLTRFRVPVRLTGTEFQQQVWQELQQIDHGNACSYGELAARIGRPGAARAVGLANNRNPVPVIVPCHRVIAANGRLQGYAGGLEMKAALLKLERFTEFRTEK